ncbi:hypothetical protein HBO14_09815 [Pseudomonas sp. WS 5406]|nr:hypothetical protein [Pseudomonas sp. WS 5406]
MKRCRKRRCGRWATRCTCKNTTPVGASLLAKIANDNAGQQIKRGAFAFFASKLAPTGDANSPVNAVLFAHPEKKPT